MNILNVLTVIFTTLTVLLMGKYEATAQSPNWVWERSAGDTLSDGAASVATDLSGNVYVTGSFRSTSIIFGAVSLNNSLTGSEDMYIVKYDPSGNILWAKSAGGSSNEFGRCVRTDSKGNAYVIGCFESSSVVFGTTTLKNNGGSDVFVVKYDPAGNVVWATALGDSGNEYGNGVSVDAAGNVYVVGDYFSSFLSVGLITLSNYAVGYSDMFIVKYGESGNVLWAKTAGGNRDDHASSISVGADGSFYLTGSFRSATLEFSSAVISNTKREASDTYIARFNPAGNALWMFEIGGDADDVGNSVAIERDGGVFITGYFTSSKLIFHAWDLINNHPGEPEMFIAKFDQTGKGLWARSAGSSGMGIGSSVTTDGRDAFVTGTFSGVYITFGSTELSNRNVGYTDIFIARYDYSGNLVWVKSTGGNGNDSGNGIAADQNGYLYLTGTFQDSSIMFGSAVLNNTGATDMFLAKLNGSVVSVTDSHDKMAIDLVPTSLKGIFQLNSSTNKRQLVICSMLGIPVYESEFATSQTIINLSVYPKGMYVYLLRDDQGLERMGKIIIE